MVIVIQGMCILSQTYHSKCNYGKLILTSENFRIIVQNDKFNLNSTFVRKVEFRIF